MMRGQWRSAMEGKENTASRQHGKIFSIIFASLISCPHFVRISSHCFKGRGQTLVDRSRAKHPPKCPKWWLERMDLGIRIVISIYVCMIVSLTKESGSLTWPNSTLKSGFSMHIYSVTKAPAMFFACSAPFPRFSLPVWKHLSSFDEDHVTDLLASAPRCLDTLAGIWYLCHSWS